MNSRANINIHYLRHNEIDRQKWDKCILSSVNGIIYAFSWYLDIVCEGWQALVSNDYEAVMPLPAFRKYGINYLAQPFFTQQLGVFSTKKMDEELITRFMLAIPPKFKYIDLKLNTFNLFNHPGFQVTRNVTYEMDLIQPYNQLYRKYAENTKRNLKKAMQNKVYIVKGLSANSLINLKKEYAIHKLTESNYNTIRKIMSFALRRRIGYLYEAYTRENTLGAAAFFLVSHNKAIYLFAGSSEMGKENRAMFMLADHFIRENAEKNLTLDFEGSNNKNVARFFAGFGAHPCQYLSVKSNRLPWYLRMVKR